MQRTLRLIQGQMDQLEVGSCCYVKVSYIDSRGGISPYKYNIELIDTPPCESHHNCSDTADSGNVGLPSAAPSIDNLYPPFMEEIGSDWGESSDLPDNEPVKLADQQRHRSTRAHHAVARGDPGTTRRFGPDQR